MNGCAFVLQCTTEYKIIANCVWDITVIRFQSSTASISSNIMFEYSFENHDFNF